MKITVKDQAIIYLRVSTTDQATDAYGLESQERACRRLCEERGWNIVRVFKDAGFSAWKQDVERLAFLEMMEWLPKNKSVNLVFFDYSRFARNTLAALEALKKLEKLGVYYVAADNPTLDCRTAAGRTAIRDAFSKAEDFSDVHSEKTRLRMQAAFEDGRWCRPAPLGYRTVKLKLKGKSNLERDERKRSSSWRLSSRLRSDMRALWPSSDALPRKAYGPREETNFPLACFGTCSETRYISA